MPLRIAFCGTGGTGKTTLTKWLIDEVIPFKLMVPMNEIYVLGSATRATRDLCGVELCEAAKDETQLWSQTMRRFWEFEHQDKQVLVSERCGIDEAGYQQVRCFQLQKELESGLVLANGNSSKQEKMAQLQLAGAMANVLINIGVNEVSTYWDFVYFKRPWEGIAFEDDGVRSVDKEYNELVDSSIAQFVEMTNQVLGLKIIEIPRELSEAKEFLRGEVPKWQEALTRTD